MTSTSRTGTPKTFVYRSCSFVHSLLPLSNECTDRLLHSGQVLAPSGHMQSRDIDLPLQQNEVRQVSRSFGIPENSAAQVNAESSRELCSLLILSVFQEERASTSETPLEDPQMSTKNRVPASRVCLKLRLQHGDVLIMVCICFLLLPSKPFIILATGWEKHSNAL